MVVRAYPAHGADTLGELEQRVLTAMLAMQRRSWEQGVASHAILDWGLDPLARVIARDAVMRQDSEGKLAEIDNQSVVNSGAVVEVVQWAADVDADDSLQHAADRQIDFLLTTDRRADDGTLFHMEGSREVWIDTAYMVIPALVLAGELSEARKQFRGHRDRLFDAEAGLYGARWSEDDRVVHHPEHWGSGTGWMLAGIARSIRLLGDREPDFAAELSSHARILIDACLALRHPDGTFRNVLDDPGSFEEGTVGEMLAFSIASGILDGWVPATYRAHVDSLVQSARSLVDADGYVSRVCGAPMFESQGVSVEGQAFFLLASTAHRRLGPESSASPTL
ncbi:glycoside hydrolase family 88 protein [Marisediminicola sp. LYQ85]|uniref:glycoside hydrolase family 88 protein n=1 Tax=Marisediminicola sp. LYQ85 TaxID=3391062 RepID=UPI003983B3EB